MQWGIGSVLVAVALAFAIRYWTHGRIYVSTDNAYVNAHTVEVAAQVSGPVVALYVRDNQAVAQDQPLFQIDPRPYQLALDRAGAQLEIARQSVSQQAAAVSAAQAQLAQREAELRNARSNYACMEELVRQGFLSRQGGEAASTQLATAQAAVKAAHAAAGAAAAAQRAPADERLAAHAPQLSEAVPRFLQWRLRRTAQGEM